MLPGTNELLLIVLAVFLMFGGKELPRIARTIGKWTAFFRQGLSEVRREFNRISIEEEMRELKDQVTEEFKDNSDLEDISKNLPYENDNKNLEKIREEAVKKAEEERAKQEEENEAQEEGEAEEESNLPEKQ